MYQRNPETNWWWNGKRIKTSVDMRSSTPPAASLLPPRRKQSGLGRRLQHPGPFQKSNRETPAMYGYEGIGRYLARNTIPHGGRCWKSNKDPAGSWFRRVNCHLEAVLASSLASSHLSLKLRIPRKCLWFFSLTILWSTWLSTGCSVYCPYQQKRKGSGAPS